MNVSAFSLDLAHPSLADKGTITVAIDGVNVQAAGGAVASFVKDEKTGWNRTDGEGAENPGVMNGGRDAALRHLYGGRE